MSDEGLEEALEGEEDLFEDGEIDQSDFFGDGDEIEEDGGSQAIAGRTLEAGDKKRLKMLERKYQYERARKKEAWKKLSRKQKLVRLLTWPARVPLNHYKKNFKQVAVATAIGGAVAFGVAAGAAAALGTSLALLPVICTLPLAYPAWKVLPSSGEFGGFWLGQFLNGRRKTSYRQLRTAPAGLWTGRVLAATLIASGGVFGEAYLKSAVKAIANTPRFVVQTVPDFFVDMSPKFRNTWADPKWEVEDQAGALWQDAVNPDRKALWLIPLKARTPAEAEGITVTVPARFLPAEMKAAVQPSVPAVTPTIEFNEVKDVPAEKQLEDQLENTSVVPATSAAEPAAPAP